MQPTITYQSPLTCKTYEAIYSEEGYTRYDIFLDGNWVQFALTEGEIVSTIKFFENPGPHLGSRFD